MIRGRRTTKDGFTLVELLAVLVILSILMLVLLPRLSGFSDTAKVRTTKAFFSQLAAAIGEYEDRFGDYPPSSFVEAWGSAPNTTNLGGECLVLAMWSPEWSGTALPEDRFLNTDNDEAKKILSRLPILQLKELRDEWDNPIAYFHRRDYGRQDAYIVTRDDDEGPGESTVRARKNPATNTWFHHDRFQLLSAGPDGDFGTDDDIGNFEVEAEEPKK